MKNIIHADIFFFITSIFVVILTICLIIAMYYVARILRDMKHISRNVSEEGDKILDDIDNMREKVKEEGTKVMTIAEFFLNLFVRRQKMSKDKNSKAKNQQDEAVDGTK